MHAMAERAGGDHAGPPSGSEDVPAVSVDDLREMLDRGEPVTLLDVRSGESRAEWSIPGSLHVDASDALKGGRPEVLDAVALPRGAPVVAVCNAGNTSRIAARHLRRRGLAASSLAGGMKAWSLAWNTAEVPVPRSRARVFQVRRTGKGCLSYVIGSEDRATVLDPSVEPRVYERLAQAAGWSIVRILETHVHADHLSRARALSESTGASLEMPAQRRVSFPFRAVYEGDRLPIGAARLEALHLPGHTMESTAYLLDGVALFTGDTLFLDGIGRPDLEVTPEETRERARHLHRSLERLLSLPPDLLVLPGHTARPVAFDGQPLAATLEEVAARVDLARAPEAEFVAASIARIPPTPPNHRRIVQLNEAGLGPDGDPTELEAGANRCAVA